MGVWGSDGACAKEPGGFRRVRFRVQGFGLVGQLQSRGPPKAKEHPQNREDASRNLEGKTHEQAKERIASLMVD